MFKIGKIYQRSILHDNFGGNRQGGIANCANYPYIFLFTAKAGEQHGYEDGGIIKNQEGSLRSAKDYNKPTTTERKGLVISRVRQGWYRKVLLNKWRNKCAVTGCPFTRILKASHIVPWKDSSDQQRLDIDNGILLAPNLDALFDKHFISFDEEGGILLKSEIPNEIYSELGVSKNMRLRFLNPEMQNYLNQHRKIFSTKLIDIV